MKTCCKCDNPALEDGDYCAVCEEKAFKRIGGWLWLPAIGLLISVLLNGYVGGYILYLLLTTLGQLDSTLTTVFVGQAALSISAFALAVYVSTLFIRKKRQLPAFYSAMLVYGVFVTCADSWLGSFYLDGQTRDTAMAIGRNVIGAAIWISYFRVSVRVKRTFIH